MAGWKALTKGDRDWLADVIRGEIARQQTRVTVAEMHDDNRLREEAERKISVAAIGLDVLQKASPPDER